MRDAIEALLATSSGTPPAAEVDQALAEIEAAEDAGAAWEAFQRFSRALTNEWRLRNA